MNDYTVTKHQIAREVWGKYQEYRSDWLKGAREYHKEQKRPIGNEDYITHPEAVVKLVGEDIELQIVAWLHDVLEDSDLQPEDLEEKGISRYLVQSVEAITRQKDQNYKDYILQVKEDEIATKVKIADLRHNLSDLKNGSMRDKYILALYILKKFQGEEE